MTESVLRYLPTDPAGVDHVDRLRLYATVDRTGTLIADLVGPTLQDDGAWLFQLPDLADGTYYASITTTYLDGFVGEDANDVVTLPLRSALQLGDPLEPWATAAQVKAAVPAATDDEAAAAVQMATDVLYALSGRRYPGLRLATLSIPPGRQGPSVPLPLSAPWAGPVGSRLGGACCPASYDPRLYPIRSVVRLLVGDTEIPAEQIKVDGERQVRIVRGVTSDPLAVNYYVDDSGTYSLWPGGCGCARPSIELTITWGADVPVGGVQAARLFAIELCKALRGDEGCRLPGNLISVSRQGVSIVLDPATFLDKKRTGIPLVDTWLAAVNPNGLKAETMLWWPENPLPEVVG